MTEIKINRTLFQRIQTISLLILVVIGFYILYACHSASRTERYDQNNKFYLVTKVIDGDTFWIEEDSPEAQKIRLIGIDAPETMRTAKKDIGYYGEESKEYLKKLILDKRVRLEYDIDTFDVYRRTLAYVYLEDGTFLNAKLLKEGYASVMTVPPNVKYADIFVKLASKARKKKKGLWAEK